MIDTKTGHHRIPFEDNFNTLGFSLNRWEKRQDCLEEGCKQGLERREDLQRQRRALESEVQKDGGMCLSCFFGFGSGKWSWSQATLDRIKGWETKAMRRLFRFEKEEDETWTD